MVPVSLLDDASYFSLRLFFIALGFRSRPAPADIKASVPRAPSHNRQLTLRRQRHRLIERSFDCVFRPTDPDYLAQLQDYYAQHGVMPSLASLGELVGLRSKASAAALANRLKLAGYLTHTPDRRLAPTERFFERVVVDTVRAGLPQAANDPGTEAVAIDRFLVSKPSRTVVLVVKGDSMIDAGLLEGDRLVVDRGRAAVVGDIVVAIVDNQLTVKYLARDKRGIHLKPGNPDYDLIRPQGEMEIYGVVTGSFRKYR